MKVVSLFSGAGGLDLGFKMAGHEIIWANDLYEDALKIIQNHGENLAAGQIGDAFHVLCQEKLGLLCTHQPEELFVQFISNMYSAAITLPYTGRLAMQCRHCWDMRWPVDSRNTRGDERSKFVSRIFPERSPGSSSPTALQYCPEFLMILRSGRGYLAGWMAGLLPRCQ